MGLRPWLRVRTNSWSWKFRFDGVESVCSAYEVLSGSDQMSAGVSEETIRVNLVWKIWASSKVQVFFFWQLLLYRIPSRLNPFKYIVITDLASIFCVMCVCWGGVESVDHLFVTCKVASII